MAGFAPRPLGRTGKLVGPLGLAASFGVGETGVEIAHERGVNYFYWGSMRKTAFGPERIGSVLAGQTRMWVGESLGIGFYRAGGYAVGFVFKPDRGGVDDRVALPKIRGRLLDAHAVLAGDRAWLFLMTEQGTTCVIVDEHARVLATEALVDATWLSGVYGAVAAGDFLFVPTDDGVARIEVVQNTITATRVFAETAPLVGATDRLVLSPGGLDVIRRRDAIRMQLS